MKSSKNIKYYLPLLVLLAADISTIAGFGNSGVTNMPGLKWALLFIAVVVMTIAQKDKKYWGWLLFFLFLFAETKLKIHSWLGGFFYNIFGMTTARGSLLMQYFAAIFLTFIFLAPVAEMYKKASRAFRQYSGTTFIILAAFIFFWAVPGLAQQLGILSQSTPGDMIKNAGTSITLSILAGYSFYKAFRKESS